jgi:hypothetical protein
MFMFRGVLFEDCYFVFSRVKQKHEVTPVLDRAIAQVVSRRLPATAGLVQSCGICGGQSGNGAGFLRVLLFPLSVITIFYAGRYNRPISGLSNSGLGSTQAKSMKNNAMCFI